MRKKYARKEYFLNTILIAIRFLDGVNSAFYVKNIDKCLIMRKILPHTKNLLNVACEKVVPQLSTSFFTFNYVAFVIS